MVGQCHNSDSIQFSRRMKNGRDDRLNLTSLKSVAKLNHQEELYLFLITRRKKLLEEAILYDCSIDDVKIATQKKFSLAMKKICVVVFECRIWAGRSAHDRATSIPSVSPQQHSPAHCGRQGKSLSFIKCQRPS